MGVRFLREVGRDPLYKIWHSSRDALLLYVHAGQGHAVSREKLCPLRPGTLCFIGGDVEHYTVPHDPSIYDRSKLFVDQATLSTLLSLLPETSPLRALSYLDVSVRGVPLTYLCIQYVIHGSSP